MVALFTTLDAYMCGAEDVPQVEKNQIPQSTIPCWGVSSCVLTPVSFDQEHSLQNKYATFSFNKQ